MGGASFRAMQWEQEVVGLFIRLGVPLKPRRSAAAKPDRSLALEAFNPGEIWGKF